jgi:hypothetical protein
MATLVSTATQSLTEIRTHLVDFTNDLPSGVTVSTATATHTPPTGAASTPTVSTALAPIVQVTLGPLSVTGMHKLSVLATLSDGEKSEVLLQIPVNW